MKREFKIIDTDEVWFDPSLFGEDEWYRVSLEARTEQGPADLIVMYMNKQQFTIDEDRFMIDRRGVRFYLDVPDETHYIVVAAYNTNTVIEGSLET